LKKQLLSFLSLLFICAVAHAQLGKKYAFTHYGATQGIASNEVITSLQDEDGYIWIGTTNGLQRYDGIRFLTFRHEKNNPASLPASYIREMHLDKKKNLWVQVSSGQVGIFDTKNFSFLEVPVRPSDPQFAKEGKGIVMDDEGNIMVLIADRELLTYNEKKKEFSPKYNFISFPEGWKVVGIYPLPGTKKYIITSRQGMAIYNKETKQLSYQGHNVANEKLIDEYGSLYSPVGFMLDRQGRLWFDTWK